jgi:hypothetical protein
MSGTSRVLGNDGQPEEHCFQIGDMRAALPPLPTTEALLVAPGALAKPAAPARGKPTPLVESATSTKRLLVQLRARLRVVEREIRARRKLEGERAQLQRLISAAVSEQDNVRRIRSAG